MKIDAHQHFWKVDRGDYGWLTPDVGPIYRDFEPEDLAPILDAAGIDGTVLVQAAPTVDETVFMLSLADAHGFVKGVVGWVDFESADAPADIERLARHSALVGLRPMIQDIPDPDWMLRDDLAGAFETLNARDLVFDALVLPRHLKTLALLVERYDAMKVVIDHGAKPRIADGGFSGWAEDMARLAENPNVHCKLSGLVTEAGRDWSVEALRPYTDHLIGIFGPDRVVWGSDWPVCTLAASYEAWLEATARLIGALDAGERELILGGNARRLYGL